MAVIDHESNQPYYEQLVAGIKLDILHGILQVGDQLPSVREMARQQVMNPNTVSRAYRELEAQQIIHTIRGRGTYVSQEPAPQRDDQRISQLKGRLEKVLVDAHYLGVTDLEIDTWIQELRGKNK